MSVNAICVGWALLIVAIILIIKCCCFCYSTDWDDSEQACAVFGIVILIVALCCMFL